MIELNIALNNWKRNIFILTIECIEDLKNINRLKFILIDCKYINKYL